jgi:hypothetical protein
MTKLCTPISAGTSFPNTPESDKQQFVSHDVNVELTDGTLVTVRLSATDGGEAIDRIKRMSDETFSRLQRVPQK